MGAKSIELVSTPNAPPKNGSTPLEYLRSWAEPSILLALVGVGLGAAWWFLKLDDRVHDLAQGLAQTKESVGSLENRVVTEFDELNASMSELVRMQAIILTNQQRATTDLDKLEKSHQDHVTKGAHAQAEERLRSHDRRFTSDDERAREIERRLLQLERDRPSLFIPGNQP